MSTRGKLQKQNDAWHEALAEMEKAIFNVKCPVDGLQTDTFIKRLQDDLNTILELHHLKLGTQKNYLHMRYANEKLRKKLEKSEKIEEDINARK